MSDFSATDVAFAGIRFVRHNPRTAAIWAGAQIVISLVLGAFFVVTLAPGIAQLQALGQTHSSDPTQALAIMGRIWPMFILFFPLTLVINAVIYTTMARAVLQPGDDSLGYIRFGRDELLMFLLLLLWFLLVIAAEVVAGIALAVPIVIVSLVAESFQHLAIALCILCLVAAVIFFLVRLSLSFALTFDTQRVNLFGSFKLTRNHFWKMLGAYLLVVGLALVMMILIAIISTAVAAVLGGIGAAAMMFRPNVATMAAFFAPAQLAVTVIWAVATPLFWALFLMPPVEIYRQLRETGDA